VVVDEAGSAVRRCSCRGCLAIWFAYRSRVLAGEYAKLRCRGVWVPVAMYMPSGNHSAEHAVMSAPAEYEPERVIRLYRPTGTG